MDFTIQVALAVTVVLAAVTDIQGQRVPNWLTFSATLVALSLHILSAGPSGALFAVSGLAAGFALLIGFYAAGGMGAGDVKLLAAVGAFVGAKQVLLVFLCAALLGGVYALCLLVAAAVTGFAGPDATQKLRLEAKTFLLTGGDPEGFVTILRSYPKLRYAVVIALGVAAARYFDGAFF